MNILSKIDEKQKPFAYVAIGFLLLAFVDRLFWSPALDRLSGLQEQIKEQKTIIMRDLRILSYKENIDKEMKVLGKFFVDKIQDDDVVNAEFLRGVEKIATQSSITLAKSNVATSQKHKDYIEYTANVECGGTLANIVTFMHAINSSDDLLRISKFNMAPKKGSQDEVTVTMSISKIAVGPNIPQIASK